MKVIIAGSRAFDDYTLLRHKCDQIIGSTKAEIVSGTAQGADKLGEKYATEKGLPVKRFPANCKLNGNSAGHIRNAEMAEYADTLIAFWDGQSKGTAGMIRVAEKKGLRVFIVSP